MQSLREVSARHFHYTRDGRTIFFPGGPAQQGYLVPDLPTEIRIERVLKGLAIAEWLLCFVVIDIAVQWDPEHWGWWIASLALLPFLHFKVREWAAESLQPLHDSDVQQNAMDGALREETIPGLQWQLFAGVIVLVFGGAFAWYSGEWRWPIVFMMAGGVLTLITGVQQLREKRESETRREARRRAWRTRES